MQIMTRFARAKGSKASNERIPDEPTPWHEMKQQLVEAAGAKFSTPKPKTAKELLQENSDLFYTDTIGNLNNDWADIEPMALPSAKKNPSTPKTKTPSKHNHEKPAEEKENVKTSAAVDSNVSPKKAKKRKSGVTAEKDNKSNVDNVATTSVAVTSPTKIKFEAPMENTIQNDVETTVAAASPKKIKIEHTNDASIPATNETNPDPAVRKKKKNRSKKNRLQAVADSEGTPTITDAPADEKTDTVIAAPTVKLSKRQKRNRKHKAQNSNEPSESIPEVKTTVGAFDTEGNDWGSDVKFGGTTNTEKNEPENKFRGPSNPPRQAENQFGNGPLPKKRKPPKIRDDLEHKRRKPTPPSSKVIINGLEVEIVMYDGFFVQKNDAERLTDLRKQMIMKGIPKPEVNSAMKLERRKAEKALARIKKSVCFHCRKAGHNLSDCPDLGKEESATGICFKCGSTEHTHFQCKVNKNEEYRFAKCFICREQGHVAKQCPDNPKGLYPQGGACKMCGDVTHLKKDCPELARDREESTMTLGTIANSNLEALDGENLIKKTDDGEKLKNKIVKF